MAHKNGRKSQTHKRNKINRTKRKHHGLSKMNCSPAVKDMAPVKGSCFPAHVLLQLKEYYNSANPSTKIQDVSPSKIWVSLKHRLSTCNKEDCWLDLITDNNIRKTLDNYVFAPDQPASWKKNHLLQGEFSYKRLPPLNFLRPISIVATLTREPDRGA